MMEFLLIAQMVAAMAGVTVIGVAYYRLRFEHEQLRDFVDGLIESDRELINACNERDAEIKELKRQLDELRQDSYVIRSQLTDLKNALRVLNSTWYPSDKPLTIRWK
jgi:predicted nuclease with TOPRIM domain